MFYYRAGNISTKTNWSLPTKLAFNKWLNKWSKTTGLINYNVYLTGGFCEKYFLNEDLQTPDIDLLITPVKKTNIKYTELKNILEQAIKIGFNNKLLIDIWYNANAPYDLSLKTNSKNNISNSIIILISRQGIFFLDIYLTKM